MCTAWHHLLSKLAQTNKKQQDPCQNVLSIFVSRPPERLCLASTCSHVSTIFTLHRFSKSLDFCRSFSDRTPFTSITSEFWHTRMGWCICTKLAENHNHIRRKHVWAHGEPLSKPLGKQKWLQHCRYVIFCSQVFIFIFFTFFIPQVNILNPRNFWKAAPARCVPLTSPRKSGLPIVAICMRYAWPRFCDKVALAKSHSSICCNQNSLQFSLSFPKSINKVDAPSQQRQG